MSRFQFVADHSDTYEVKRLCRLLEVSRSSYYAWRAGAPARQRRAAADAALRAETTKLTTEREILQRAAKYFAGETRW